jgi:hydroxymethylglutaryl-CoA lyase
MAMDNLTGNMPTEVMMEWFRENNIETGIHPLEFNNSYNLSATIFN